MATPKYVYAREVVEGGPSKVARFSSRNVRALWVKRDRVNRFLVDPKSPMALRLAQPDIEWSPVHTYYSTATLPTTLHPLQPRDGGASYTPTLSDLS